MKRAVYIVGQILAFVRAAMACAVIALFVSMMAAVLVQIGGRYLFNYSIAGAGELATFAQVWMVLLGAGIAMRRGQHVAVDILPTLLPLPWARIVSLFIAVGALWFLGVVVKGSLALLELGMVQTSSALALPMWIVYLCLPVGAVYFGLEIIATIFRRWNQPFGVEVSPENVDHT